MTSNREADLMRRYLIEFGRMIFLFLLLLSVGSPVSAATPPEPELNWPKVPECFPSARHQTYEATWIRHKEPNPPDNSYRYFRKTFPVLKPLKRAVLRVMYDDDLRIWVNGISSRPGRNYVPIQQDVTAALHPGKNVLAMELFNGIADSGLVVRLELQYQDGTVENICSDLSWRSSSVKEENWNKPEFDDSSWTAVISAGGSVECAPWGYYIPDVTPMFTQKDLEKHRKIQRLQRERRIEIQRQLATEKPQKVHLQYRNGSPWIVMGDKAFPGLMYQSPKWAFEDARFIEQLHGLREAGFRFYGTGITLRELWTASGLIDEKRLFQTLENALNLVPDGYFMIDVNLWTPNWWLRANPDELVGYSNNRAIQWVDDNAIPPTTQNCAEASYASEKWYREAGEALRRIIGLIEHSPYASRILAYRLDAGIYGEWHYYGMFQEMPDNGKRMTERFRAYLRRYYNNDEKVLQTAWNDPGVTFETAQVPAPKARQDLGGSSLRDGRHDRQVLDYLTLHGKVVTEAPLRFNRIAKEACKGRALIGNFFGYYYSMDFPSEGWHQDAARYVDDPASDFAASPYAYPAFFRQPGRSGLPRTYIESFRLRGNKAAFLEADTGTHLSVNYSDQHSNGVQSAVALLTRDFAQSLIRGAVVWYFDFGNCWYDDPVILDFFRKLPPILQNAGDCSGVSRVAVVADLSSVPYQTDSVKGAKVSNVSIDENVAEISQAGAMFDTILFEDLARPEADRYQVCVFPASFYMNDSKCKVIDRLRKAGKTLVWCGPAGYLTDSGTSLAQMKQTTNIRTAVEQMKAKQMTSRLHDKRIMESERLRKWGPVFFIDDPQASVLGTMDLKGKPLATYAEKASGHGGKDVLITTAKLTRSEWKRIFRNAGVHIYDDDYRDTILANRDHVAVTSTVGGERLIRLPEPVRAVRQLLPEAKDIPVHKNGKSFRCQLPKDGTAIFQLMR